MKNRRRKRDLISQVQERTNINKIAVERVVEAFLEELASVVVEDGRIEIRDFGIFEAVLRAERSANNPKTGERIALPRKRIVKFKAGKRFANRVASEAFCESLK